MTDSTFIGFFASVILAWIAGTLLLIGSHLQAGSFFIFLGFTIGSFSSLLLWKVKGITVVNPVTSIIALLSSMIVLTTVLLTLS